VFYISIRQLFFAIYLL